MHGFLRSGGEILASGGIREAYETGRGPVTVRGRAFIEGTSEASTSAPASSQGRFLLTWLQWP